MAVSKEVISRTNDFINDYIKFFEKAPIDINKIIELKNINIEEYPFDEDISGVLIIDKLSQKSTIGVNTNQNTFSVRKNFTLAHELGHFVLHNDISNTFVDKIFFRKKSDGYTTKEEKIEREANYFAANVLMPEHLIQKEIENINNDFLFEEDNIVEDLAAKFSVSKSAMLYRLINLGII